MHQFLPASVILKGQSPDERKAKLVHPQCFVSGMSDSQDWEEAVLQPDQDLTVFCSEGHTLCPWNAR